MQAAATPAPEIAAPKPKAASQAKPKNAKKQPSKSQKVYSPLASCSDVRETDCACSTHDYCLDRPLSLWQLSKSVYRPRSRSRQAVLLLYDILVSVVLAARQGMQSLSSQCFTVTHSRDLRAVRSMLCAAHTTLKYSPLRAPPKHTPHTESLSADQEKPLRQQGTEQQLAGRAGGQFL